MNWENVYIFISSTFNDMHAERDYLVKRVFPELRLWCNKRKLKLMDVDLRWGVSEKDATENKRVLEVCLNNVDKCRPFFLCMLGQRRGWIPGIEDINEETMIRFPEIENYLGRYSITELEIIHALLHPFDMQQKSARHAFFYTRNGEYLADIEDDSIKKIFYESKELEKNQEELRWFRESIEEKYPFVTYSAKWNMNKRSMELTNVNGEDLSKGRLDHFSIEEESLAEHILKQLKEAIKDEFPEHFQKREYEDVLQEELNEQATFLFNACESYIEREKEECVISDYIKGDSVRPLVVLAAAGNGKTSLLANQIRKWNNDLCVFYRFVGTSKRSKNVQDTLYYLLLEMSRNGLISENLIEENKHDLIIQFPNLLEKMVGKSFCIILDAVDQWAHASDHSMRWLPELLPKGIKLIISVKSDTNPKLMQKIESKNVMLYSLGGLCKKDDKALLIKSYLAQFLKDIDENQIESILALKGSDNPLYLKIVLNELRIHGSFDTLLNQLKTDYGKTPVEAFDIILERLEHEVFSEFVNSKELVHYTLGLAAYSLEGIKFDEFISIFREYANVQEECENEEIMDAIYGLCRHLATYLVLDGGRVDFFYDSFRQAVKTRYSDKEKQFHHILATIYYKDCGLETQKQMNESDMVNLVYHALECSKEWTEKILTHAGFIMELIRKTSAIHTAEYYEQASVKYPKFRDANVIANYLRKQAARLDISPNVMFSELHYRRLYSNCMINKLVESAGMLNIEYFKMKESSNLDIYEADQEIRLYNIAGQKSSPKTVIAGKYIVVYEHENNYVVLQNIETGEVERQVRLRKKISEIYASENRLDITYKSEKKNAENQTEDDRFLENLKCQALESFIIPSMESVFYIEKWPEAPEGFSWSPFAHAYDGTFYITACGKKDTYSHSEIYCLNENGLGKCIKSPGSKYTDISRHRYKEYMVDEVKENHYRCLLHLPSGKVIYENFHAEEDFLACMEDNKVWFFEKKTEDDIVRVTGRIYEKCDKEIKEVYEYTFSEEDSRNIRFAKEVVACQENVYFLREDGIICVYDKMLKLIGSKKVPLRFDYIRIVFFENGWNGVLNSDGKHLLFQDKNRMLLFESKELTESIKMKYSPMLSEGTYHPVVHKNKLFLIEYNDFSFCSKKVVIIDLDTDYEKVLRNSEDYDFDFDNKYEIEGKNGKKHTCLLGYSRSKKKLCLLSLDTQKIIFSMNIKCKGNYYFGSKPFMIGNQYAIVENDDTNARGDGCWDTENIYYYEAGNEDPVDVWKVGNAFQEYQLENVMNIQGTPYYLSRGNVIEGESLDEKELLIYNLCEKQIVGRYRYNERNNTMSHENYVSVLNGKICVHMKCNNHPVKDGTYRIMFDVEKKEWKEVFLTDGQFLRETENLIFWVKEDSMDVYVERTDTRKVIGILNCASKNYLRTVIIKDDYYVVVHEAGICEVFSKDSYERRFVQMIDTDLSNWSDCEDTDRICFTSEYLKYVICRLESTKELVKERTSGLESLDALFD